MIQEISTSEGANGSGTEDLVLGEDVSVSEEVRRSKQAKPRGKKQQMPIDEQYKQIVAKLQKVHIKQGALQNKQSKLLARLLQIGETINLCKGAPATSNPTLPNGSHRQSREGYTVYAHQCISPCDDLIDFVLCMGPGSIKVPESAQGGCQGLSQIQDYLKQEEKYSYLKDYNNREGVSGNAELRVFDIKVEMARSEAFSRLVKKVKQQQMNWDKFGQMKSSYLREFGPGFVKILKKLES